MIMGIQFPTFLLIIIWIIVFIFLFGRAIILHGYEGKRPTPAAVLPMIFHFMTASLLISYEESSEFLSGLEMVTIFIIFVFFSLLFWGDKVFYGRLRGSIIYGAMAAGLVIITVFFNESITQSDLLFIVWTISIVWMLTIDRFNRVYNNLMALKKAILE